MTRRAALVLAGVTIALGACGSDQASTQGASEPPLPRGAEVYAARCASCHGADLRGTDKGPSHLSIVYEPGHHSDESFRRAIALGAPQHHWSFGAMPPVAGLSDDDIDAVIAFVRAEQQRQGFDG